MNGKKVTLNEKVSEGKLSDTDLYLTVNPMDNWSMNNWSVNNLKDLDKQKKLFETVVWKSVDQFVLKQTIKVMNLRPIVEPDRNIRQLSGYESENENGESYFEDSEDSDDDIQELENIQYNASDYLPKIGTIDWFENIDVESVIPRNSHLINIHRPIGVNTIGSTYKNITYDIRGHASLPRFTVSPWQQNSVNLNYNDIPDITHRNLCDRMDSADNIQDDRQEHVNANWNDTFDHMPIKRTMIVNHDDLAQSYSGKVIHSNTKFKPETVDVDINVLYEISAQTHFDIVLLHGNYRVNQVKDSDKSQEVSELLDEYVNQTYELLISKVYETYECVCCMDNLTNTLFYTCTCGHSCVCKDCSKKINKCPMCQNGITVILTKHCNDKIRKIIDEDKKIAVSGPEIMDNLI